MPGGKGVGEWIIFLFFIIKLVHFIENTGVFICNIHSSLTSKIGKLVKTKFGRIDLGTEKGLNMRREGQQGSISPKIYAQLLRLYIPKAQKGQSTQAAFCVFGIFRHTKSACK